MNCLRYHPSHGQITIKHFRLHRRYSSHTAFYELTQFHRRKCPILCCWLTSKKKPFTSLVFADARARALALFSTFVCAFIYRFQISKHDFRYRFDHYTLSCSLSFSPDVRTSSFIAVSSAAFMFTLHIDFGR